MGNFGNEARIARLGQFAEIDLGGASSLGGRHDASEEKVGSSRLADQQRDEKGEEDTSASHGWALHKVVLVPARPIARAIRGISGI
ncbi:MAG TPA: hypothetical protein VGY58_17580 [Gemmataceae bacterium]|nr:hypothetical protein [Gemmataceae bacterium]